MDRKTWLLDGICALLFAYCAARVELLSMTHDEATTVLEYATRTWGAILANEPPSANNHLLNTLLVKVFTLGALNKVFVRLPNLLAGAMFLYFARKMLLRADRTFSGRVLGMALLVFNPYMLEFFALARGYGLSLGFMMGSLYFAWRFLEEERPAPLAWSALFAVAGCYSNLTMLNYFVGLWGAANLFLLLRKGGANWKLWQKSNGILLLLALLLFALLYVPVQANREAGAFYFGGNTSLFTDTFRSLVAHFTTERLYLGPDTTSILAGLAGALLLAAAGQALWNLVKNRQPGPRVFYVFVLLIMALSTEVQHQWLGTPYLTGRTALLFYPLMGLMVWSLLWHIPNWGQWALSALLAVNMLAVANLAQSQDWWYDRYTDAVTRYVAGQRQGEEHLRFGANWLFVPTISYYRKAWDIDFFIGPNMDREVPTDKYFDYYYLHWADTAGLHPDYEPEKSFGDYVLMKLPPGKKEKPGEQ